MSTWTKYYSNKKHYRRFSQCYVTLQLIIQLLLGGKKVFSTLFSCKYLGREHPLVHAHSKTVITLLVFRTFKASLLKQQEFEFNFT